MTRIDIAAVAAVGEVLAGSMAGKRLLTRLIESTPEPTQQSALLLDFRGIKAATASYLRESALALKDYYRQRDSHLFPVAANLSSETREELEFCLRAKADVMLCCSLDASGRVTDLELAGQLDSNVQLAFFSVQHSNEIDASTIWKKHQKSQPVSVNAWNNRLSSLHQRGVIFEEVRGRTKVYRPVLQET
ncbi:MAG: hypothetical protein R3D05_12880 [Dongiaceae bacterium]